MIVFDDVDFAELVRRTAEVAIVLALAVLLNALVGLTLRYLTRRAVDRALDGKGRWRVRLPRPHDGPDLELRRRQRADAAAHMLSRLSSLVIAAVAALAVAKVLDIDPVVLVSSAGFLGAGVAFGGQAFIKDWLSGLVVLLEDRYAVGDQVELFVGGETSTGVVETISAVSVRLRLPDGSTWHTGHGSVDSVTNRSQQFVAHTMEIPGDVWAELDETMIGPDLNAASHDPGLTGVLIAEEVTAATDAEGNATVTFQTSKPLTDRQRRMLERRILGEQSED